MQQFADDAIDWSGVQQAMDQADEHVRSHQPEWTILYRLIQLASFQLAPSQRRPPWGLVETVKPEVACSLIRDVFNPFAAAIPCSLLGWNGGAIPAIARHIDTQRAFDRLPILADALEEAGCTDADVLAHCRGPGPHVRGCWVVDWILGTE
jgi:hypothetical protein